MSRYKFLGNTKHNQLTTKGDLVGFMDEVIGFVDEVDDSHE